MNGRTNHLEGVRVLDLSRVLAGPFCCQVLGDLGAEVIKIERPGTGDETRQWGPPFTNHLSAYFISCNRNKKSVTLDLEKGYETFSRLVKKADVIVENFLPKSAIRLKTTAKDLHALNPRAIICSITGFGQTGTDQNRPGYDFIIQALSGFMSITGPRDGEPAKTGVAITDVLTGLYSAIGILAGLQARSKTQHGYHLDMSLINSAVAAQINLGQAFLVDGKIPERQGNQHYQIVPYQVFSTASDPIVIAVGNGHQWQAFCQVLEQKDLAADDRFSTNAKRVKHRETLVNKIQQILLTKPSQTWIKACSAARIPAGLVQNYEQLLKGEFSKGRSFTMPVKDHTGKLVDLLANPINFQGSPPDPAMMPPILGQDTDAVLKEWADLKPQDLAKLKDLGII